MKTLKFVSLVALSMAVGGTGYAIAQTAAPAAKEAPKMKEFPSAGVEKYARDIAAQIEKDAELVAAIKASTAETRKLAYDETQNRDYLWTLGRAKGKDDEETKKGAKKAIGALKENGRSEADDALMAEGAKLVSSIRENAASKKLGDMKDKTGGKVTEIFVMDGNGWNVGQTDGTSDFYQGDEGKWQKTYLGQEIKRASADDVRKEDQINEKDVEVLPITEEDGIRYAQVSLPIKEGDKNIGAVTIGVDVDKVK